MGGRTKSYVIVGLLLGVVMLPAVVAMAAASPDTSGYTVFNPVPDDQLREFSTDRPTKANSPITTDARHLTYEADILNWSYDHYNSAGQTLSNFVIGDPEIKLGLTQNVDIELAGAPLNIFRTTERATGTRSTDTGFGDIYGRMKVNLVGDDGGPIALAVTPYVKAPTATSSAIGNGHWEGGAYAPLNIKLPQDWTLAFQTELDLLENAMNDGVHPNYTNLVNISHPIAGNVTGFAEFWSDVNTERNTPNQYTADFALAWLAGKNLQFDAGINVGLNKAAPDVQSYLGIAQRF